MKYSRALLLGAQLALGVLSAAHADNAETTSTSISALLDELDELRSDYQMRIDELQKQLDAAEKSNQENQAAIASIASAPSARTQSRSNAFNPAISLILEGSYANLERAPEDNSIAGWQTIEESGPQYRGLSLAESEIDISATIDPYFYGALQLALTPDDQIEIEEAFVQTTSLPAGLTVKVGRFFPDIGYLNSIHQHAWDFYDAPLVYQAFLGTEATGNYADDGAQVSWIAPSDVFLQFGFQLGRGKDYPGNDQNSNGANAAAAFVNIGGDINISQSYVAGLSYLHTKSRQRTFNNAPFFGDEGAASTFSGTTDVLIADGVWKWAPNGDTTYKNAKLQTEFFYQHEDGNSLFDPEGTANTGISNTRRWGTYVQAVYQFMPRWRTGLRFDYLSSGSVNYGSNNINLARTDYDPRRYTWMLDFSPSEFSRLRMQYALDQSAGHERDNQLFLQYIFSLGSHGAHRF